MDSRFLIQHGDSRDTVCVNLEGDLDLRDATRRGRDTSEFELAKKVVVLREGTLTLKDSD